MSKNAGYANAVATRAVRRAHTGWAVAGHPAFPPGVITLVVLLAHLPVLSGWLDPNPIHWVGLFDSHVSHGPLPGSAYVDPNVGFQSQALGHRATLDWFGGHIPWWNPYEGVGAPLAGGLQSAAFFPATILTYFQNGQLWIHLILESATGIATYFLLQELRVRRWIATLGGALFALNGTFAWIGHAPANPVAFLPLLLLGIERAFRAARESRSGGWVLVGLALALSFLAGFPETAFLDGLLATVWALVRVSQVPRARRKALLGKLVVGGATGLLVAAPLVVGVVDYLPHADIGIHAQVINDALPRAGFPLLVMPYAFGSIGAFSQYDHTGTIANLWGGGYMTTALLFLSLVGVIGARERRIRIALTAWSAVLLMRAIGVPFTFELTSHVPFLDRTLVSAYSAPSWEMAILLLAVLGLDDLAKTGVHRLWVLLAGVASAGLTGLAYLLVRSFARYAQGAPGHELAANLSFGWALLVILVLLVCAFGVLRASRTAAGVLGVILLIDVAGTFIVPELSNPRGAQSDVRLIEFLHNNLGTARFYTFGPISPNYGSYFGIASINLNDAAAPKLWTRYLSTHLDTNAEPLVFTGYSRHRPEGPDPVGEFRGHLGSYQWVGVKYVVAPSGAFQVVAPIPQLHLAYDDGVFDVFRLDGFDPFYQPSDPGCRVSWSSWDRATAVCSRRATIVRRELFMPGWSASVDRRAAQVHEYGGLFQSVDVPAGVSELSFEYVPPHASLGAVAFWSGVALLVGGIALNRISWHPGGRGRPRWRPRASTRVAH